MNELDQVQEEIERLEHDLRNAISIADEMLLEEELEKLKIKRGSLQAEFI